MYQPVIDNNEINKLKVIKNLILTSAILSTVFAVPYIGMLVGMFFQIPMIAQIIIVSIALHKIRGTSAPKTGLVFTLIISIISIVGYLFLLLYYISAFTVYAVNYSNQSLTLGMFAIITYTVLGLIVWGGYVASAIVLFINMDTLNKKIQRQTYELAYIASQSMLEAYIYAYHQPSQNPFHTPKTEVINDISEESLFSQGKIEK